MYFQQRKRFPPGVHHQVIEAKVKLEDTRETLQRKMWFPRIRAKWHLKKKCPLLNRNFARKAKQQGREIIPSQYHRARKIFLAKSQRTVCTLAEGSGLCFFSGCLSLSANCLDVFSPQSDGETLKRASIEKPGVNVYCQNVFEVKIKLSDSSVSVLCAGLFLFSQQKTRLFCP